MVRKRTSSLQVGLELVPFLHSLQRMIMSLGPTLSLIFQVNDGVFETGRDPGYYTNIQCELAKRLRLLANIPATLWPQFQRS